MSKNIQRSLFLVIALVALGVWAFFPSQPAVLPHVEALQDSASANEVVQTLTLSLDFAPGDVKTFNDLEFVRGESLLEVTERVALSSALAFAAKDFGAMGKLVTRIGQKSNGDGKAFWQFWVNGKYATVGASAYLVQPADVIEWKFTNERE